MTDNKSIVAIGPGSGILDEFYTRIGEALIMWQQVEEAHYKLFLQLLMAPNEEVAAFAYFGQESFHSRHSMVGYMTQVVLRGADKKKLRSDWGTLQKQLKDANDERNKLAHYTVNIEVAETATSVDGILEATLTSPLLRPSPHNAVSRAQGKTPDNERHSHRAYAVRVLENVEPFVAARREDLTAGEATALQFWLLKVAKSLAVLPNEFKATTNSEAVRVGIEAAAASFVG